MSANASGAKQCRILIVDDSKTVLVQERMVLARLQHEIVSASDGEEGVQKALAVAPALILLDVVMPKMDGLTALRRLRAHPATAKTPIIMVTTRGEEESVQRAYESGCTDYVTKPINALELLQKAKAYLPA